MFAPPARAQDSAAPRGPGTTSRIPGFRPLVYTTTAIDMRYFEDFKPGEVIELGSRTITKDAIMAFAKEFDPQVFHTDEEAAKATIYGGLLASGWHTGSLMMRLLYEGLLRETVSLGSPGIDE